LSVKSHSLTFRPTTALIVVIAILSPSSTIVQQAVVVALHLLAQAAPAPSPAPARPPLRLLRNTI